MTDFLADSSIALVIAFDNNGIPRLVETREGVQVVDLSGEQPPGTFRGGPINNINLRKIEELSIMVYEVLDEQRNVIRTVVCPHCRCRPTC